MLSKDAFKNGLKKLVVEYESKGFVMTPDRAEQWYDHMKELKEADFNKKIDSCLKTCRRVPFMSDVLDLKENEADRSNFSAYKPFDFRDY